MKIVIDTNVLVAALRSCRGASFKLVSLIPSDIFSIAISVPLVFEYEDALKRQESSAITDQDIGDFVDFLCETGYHQEIFFFGALFYQIRLMIMCWKSQWQRDAMQLSLIISAILEALNDSACGFSIPENFFPR